jgi:hypothetical protein
MSNLQVSQQPPFSLSMLRRKLLPPIIYAAVIPYIIYRVGTERYHLPPVDALLLAALSPVCGSLIEFARKRQLSILGLFALVGIVAKVVSALLFHDPRLILISDSLMSGVWGLLLLGSVLIGKSVVVLFIANLSGRKSPEERAQLEQRLQDPAFRRHVLILTTVWGVVLLLHQAISIPFTYTLPLSLVVLLRPVVGYGMIAVLIAVTAFYGYIVRSKKMSDRRKRENSPN